MELGMFCVPSLQAALPHVSLLRRIPVTDVLSFLLPDERIQGHCGLAEGSLLDSPSQNEDACQNDIYIYLSSRVTQTLMKSMTVIKGKPIALTGLGGPYSCEM
jgi:hypothetical protein